VPCSVPGNGGGSCPQVLALLFCPASPPCCSTRPLPPMPACSSEGLLPAGPRLPPCCRTSPACPQALQDDARPIHPPPLQAMIVATCVLVLAFILLLHRPEARGSLALPAMALLWALGCGATMLLQVRGWGCSCRSEGGGAPAGQWVGVLLQVSRWGCSCKPVGGEGSLGQGGLPAFLQGWRWRHDAWWCRHA